MNFVTTRRYATMRRGVQAAYRQRELQAAGYLQERAQAVAIREFGISSGSEAWWARHETYMRVATRNAERAWRRVDEIHQRLVGRTR